MAGINLTRVLLGGLVAGLVINIGEFVLNQVVLKEQWDAVLEKFGLADYTTGQAIAIIVITFLFGVVTVWFYAAMRPRFGPCPKAAIIAGLTMWVIAWVLLTASIFVSGMIPASINYTTMIWGLFESPLAALAGAFFYKE